MAAPWFIIVMSKHKALHGLSCSLPPRASYAKATLISLTALSNPHQIYLPLQIYHKSKVGKP